MIDFLICVVSLVTTKAKASLNSCDWSLIANPSRFIFSTKRELSSSAFIAFDVSSETLTEIAVVLLIFGQEYYGESRIYSLLYSNRV